MVLRIASGVTMRILSAGFFSVGTLLGSLFVPVFRLCIGRKRDTNVDGELVWKFTLWKFLHYLGPRRPIQA